MYVIGSLRNFIAEENAPTKTVCGAKNREQVVYTSYGSRVEFRVVGKRNKEEDTMHYMIKYRG